MTTTQAHLLIVDDEEFNLEIISEYLSEFDYKISTAIDGQIAWDMLEQSPDTFDVILLDRMMPNMNGMEVLEKIKKHPVLKYCSVIFQTAKASITDIEEGMNAGAYYYLTKPFEEELLLSIVKTAISDRFRLKEIQANLEQAKQTMGLLKSASFQFKTLEEARSIASLVSNACPEPDKIIMGLTELVVNAVEHGNLGITYDEKSELNNKGSWIDEVNKRLKLTENLDKTAFLSYINHTDSIEITVTDQGDGFDWKHYMEFDPARGMDNHGRGIAVANKLSFSSIEYKGKGNEVTAYLNLN